MNHNKPPHTPPNPESSTPPEGEPDVLPQLKPGEPTVIYNDPEIRKIGDSREITTLQFGKNGDVDVTLVDLRGAPPFFLRGTKCIAYDDPESGRSIAFPPDASYGAVRRITHDDGTKELVGRSLKEGETVILGREGDNPEKNRRFAFPDTVSNDHISITIEPEGKIIAEDRSSTNGTYVVTSHNTASPTPETARHELPQLNPDEQTVIYQVDAPRPPSQQEVATLQIGPEGGEDSPRIHIVDLRNAEITPPVGAYHRKMQFRKGTNPETGEPMLFPTYTQFAAIGVARGEDGAMKTQSEILEPNNEGKGVTFWSDRSPATPPDTPSESYLSVFFDRDGNLSVRDQGNRGVFVVDSLDPIDTIEPPVTKEEEDPESAPDNEPSTPETRASEEAAELLRGSRQLRFLARTAATAAMNTLTQSRAEKTMSSEQQRAKVVARKLLSNRRKLQRKKEHADKARHEIVRQYRLNKLKKLEKTVNEQRKQLAAKEFSRENTRTTRDRTIGSRNRQLDTYADKLLYKPTIKAAAAEMKRDLKEREVTEDYTGAERKLVIESLTTKQRRQLGSAALRKVQLNRDNKAALKQLIRAQNAHDTASKKAKTLDEKYRNSSTSIDEITRNLDKLPAEPTDERTKLEQQREWQTRQRKTLGRRRETANRQAVATEKTLTTTQERLRDEIRRINNERAMVLLAMDGIKLGFERDPEEEKKQA